MLLVLPSTASSLLPLSLLMANSKNQNLIEQQGSPLMESLVWTDDWFIVWTFQFGPNFGGRSCLFLKRPIQCKKPGLGWAGAQTGIKGPWLNKKGLDWMKKGPVQMKKGPNWMKKGPDWIKRPWLDYKRQQRNFSKTETKYLSVLFWFFKKEKKARNW